MNSIFTEENLLTYTTAAKYASFSKAAEELGITTSAVSYTIKRIETYLDVVLFIRDTRNIELTEAGYYFYRKATDLLNNFHLIKRVFTLLSRGLKLGCVFVLISCYIRLITLQNCCKSLKNNFRLAK